MLSRVADAVYWMNRYFERAENVARFIDVNLSLEIDLPEAHNQWLPIVQAAGDDELFAARYGEATRENVLRFLTFDRESPNSILSTLAYARNNARTIREVISSEMWEQINETYLFVRAASTTTESVLGTPHDFFTAVKQASQLFVGITYLTMTHNEAWHFGRVGRLVERADKTSRILDVKHFMSESGASSESAIDEIQWLALLRSASAFEMYRKRFGQVSPARVVEFLLFSRRFPRSVRYCLRKAERSLHAITGVPLGTASTSAERTIGRLAAEVEYGDLGEVLDSGLHLWLDELQIKMNKVGDAIHETFFAVARDEADRAAEELERYAVESIRPREE